MKKMVFLTVLLTVSFGIMTLPHAYGHGGGADQSPPISFAGMNVTVETRLIPSDLTLLNDDNAEMQIRLFDANTNGTLPAVTYRVAIHHLDGLLAQKLFYDEDGVLNVEIRPNSNCAQDPPWKCTTYYGSEHPTSVGALYAIGSQNPVISGPVFTNGGLYNLRIDIEGATGPKTLIDEILSFETFVSIAQIQNFTVELNNTKHEIGVKTYYDLISDFTVDKSGKHMKLSMPFDWDPSYVEQVSLVHEEIRMSKEFSSIFGSDENPELYVNGILLENNALINDPYSYMDIDVMHILITNQSMNEINEKLGKENHESNVMNIEIRPQEPFYLHSIKETKSNANYDLVVRWMENLNNNDTVLEFIFLDKNGTALNNISYGFSLWNNNGIVTEYDDLFALEGIDIVNIRNAPFENESYMLNINALDETTQLFYTTATSISMLKTILNEFIIMNESGMEIPSFMKDNIKGMVSDEANTKDITSVFSLLFDNVSVEGVDLKVPEWAKTVILWWTDGDIDDETFLNWAEYVLDNVRVL